VELIVLFLPATQRREKAMNQIFAAAGVTAAIGFSIGLALLLEWTCLRALLLLMPAREISPLGKVS
jgi:hypothetical protein